MTRAARERRQDERRDARDAAAGRALITGGAGFIGTNLANRLLSDGRPVTIFDNLSRPGVERNLRWLCDRHGPRVRVEVGDVRDPRAVKRAVKDATQVFHFAAQVAVTTSLLEPVADFEVNARGTLNLLEAMRSRQDPPSLVFTSTNKVYGDLEDLALDAGRTRYSPLDPAVRRYGVNEVRPISFHSPYGCSKGTADQYVLDYARTFKVPGAVFRMSCIYGPHQCGTEDQGWVAHFLINAIDGKTITVYGDGMQVRDVLFVEDLVDAFLRAQASMSTISGHAFNIGGGPSNTTSLVELLDHIETLNGDRPEVEFDAWRAADQRYYVSDTRRFRTATGWQAKTSVPAGLEALYRWLQEVRPPAPVQVATGTVAS
jgi:CDP-paratose 2-epimerase